MADETAMEIIDIAAGRFGTDLFHVCRASLLRLFLILPRQFLTRIGVAKINKMFQT
ncbi:MAG: hypothetical protein VZQ98_13185 [Bacteroidales bacterium]|nr:hypothetical protein [Bacteroidales bacterium]